MLVIIFGYMLDFKRLVTHDQKSLRVQKLSETTGVKQQPIKSKDPASADYQFCTVVKKLPETSQKQLNKISFAGSVLILK
jgi:hypothetical protein